MYFFNRLLCLCFVSFLMLGCVAQLKDEANMIKQSQEAVLAKKCKFLGIVGVTERGGWDIMQGRVGALNRIRNKTQTLGGDTFSVISQSHLGGLYSIEANAYNCL